MTATCRAPNCKRPTGDGGKGLCGVHYVTDVEVLEAIREITKRGYPPSIREIGEAVGLASPSSVLGHLKSLQIKGSIERVPSSPRAIIVKDTA